MRRLSFATNMGTKQVDLGDLIELGYDSEQVSMMSERVILVDTSDNEVGSMSKVDAHRGEGVLHRAFSILIFDDSDRLLLQKRAADKITFPNVWANTVCSHPLADRNENDSSELGSGAIIAAIRKMEQEMGIDTNTFSLSDIHFITRMLYRAKSGDGWTEYELDHILFARAPPNFSFEANPNEIAETKWVGEEDLAVWLEDDVGQGEIIAPWFRLIAENILTEWWGNLDNLPEMSDTLVRDYGEVGMSGDSMSSSSDEGFLLALKSHKNCVEDRINAALSKTANQRLRDAMLHLFGGGGKRLRAILPWLVADSVGNAHDGLYDLGAAIEIIHNFTLVHDDIMDNDPVRRGRPAVHVAFDHPTAINAGDAMLAVAFEVLAESPHFDDLHFRDLVRIVGGMVRKVSEGQQLDMSFEDRDIVTEAEYLQMISGKTAAMFTTCARTGALLSGADKDIVNIMAEWGEHVGLCFQLMDDLIDATGDSETLGKPACSDIIEGKQTLIAIHALQQDGDKLSNFNEVFGSGVTDTDREVLDTVLKELVDVGSIDHARKMALKHHSEAHECLNRLPQKDNLRILRELTDFQMVRIS